MDRLLRRGSGGFAGQLKHAREQGSPARPANKWLVFALVAVGIFMSTLDGSIVNVALPSILADFGAPLSTAQWVVLIYLLTVSSLLLSFGRLSDIRGRKRVYVRGLCCFSLGSAACALSPSAGLLIAARAFQGVGAAMLMACTPALLADNFPAAQRGRALGMMGTVVAGGLTLGPALGGIILSALSWHYIFWINVPVGMGGALLAHFKLHSGDTKHEAFDLPGAGLLVLFLAPLLTALSRGRDWGFSSVRFGLVLAFALLAGALFLWREHRAEHPILDLSLFKNRLFSGSAASAAAMFTSLFFVSFLMPFYLITFLGLPESRAGAILVIPFFFLFAGAYVTGWIYDRTGSRGLTTLGMIVLCAALLLLTTLDPADGLWGVYLRLAAAGVGVALFAPPNNAAILSAVPVERRGVTAATLAAARNMGMMAGVALAAAVFTFVFQEQTGGVLLKEYAPEHSGAFLAAFHTAMGVGAAVAAAGAAAAWLRGPDGPAGRRQPPA
ncbi:MAG: MFS transporter [Deltaproteobacteria bacterium]|nr:MFS transporter [Deltaproteobacteria bacterium]